MWYRRHCNAQVRLLRQCALVWPNTIHCVETPRSRLEETGEMLLARWWIVVPTHTASGRSLWWK
jgi:hypothetical protein